MPFLIAGHAGPHDSISEVDHSDYRRKYKWRILKLVGDGLITTAN